MFLCMILEEKVKYQLANVCLLQLFLLFFVSNPNNGINSIYNVMKNMEVQASTKTCQFNLIN